MMHRVTDWTEEQIDETRRAVELYKQLREITRQGKVLHLLRPDNNIPGGGWGWDAIQAMTEDKTRGVMMVYRAQGAKGEKIITPKGLEANRKYRVHFSDREYEGVFTGAQLEQDGIKIKLAEFGAEAVFFEGC